MVESETDAWVLSLLVFIGMIVMANLGRLASAKWARNTDAEPKGGLSFILGALFALSGFILAFTFGMAGNRYDNARNAAVEEANDIGTAVLRADLYSDSLRTAFRSDFKSYLEARIAYYKSILDNDFNMVNKAKEDADTASANLWARAMQQSKQPNMLIPSNNMIPALNTMFDITTTKEVLLLARVPDLIVYMLFLLTLTTSFVAGFITVQLNRRDPIVFAAFALLSSLIIYTTLDLGRPMRGLIKSSLGEQSIVDLRKMFP